MISQLGMLLASATFGADGIDPEIVELVRAGHRSAREAITSIDLELEYTQQMPRIDIPGMKFIPLKSAAVRWREQNGMVRIQELLDGGRVAADILWRDGKLKSLRRQKADDKETSQGSIVPETGVLPVTVDAWFQALFTARTHVDNKYSLDKLLADGKLLLAADRDTLNNRPCYRIRYRDFSGDGETTKWVDPRYNYLVVKILRVSTTDTSRIERMVKSFREVKPGIFFPEEVEHRTRLINGSEGVNRAVFRNVRINEPIDATVFELKYEPNTSVVDTVKGTHYEVDENEKPRRGSEAPRRQSFDERQSQEENQSWYSRGWVWFVFVGSLIVIVLIRWTSRHWLRRA